VAGGPGTWIARDAIALAYRSYNAYRARMGEFVGRDRDVRHPEWTRRLLERFGRPDAGVLNIAVTGSKGKGSHAILVAAMLQALGLRVGLFTGPHLVDFMERFRVDGEMMPEPVFIRLMEEVAAEADKLGVPPHQYIGPVGMLAVVAARWFREQRTDVNVFELGRGALHDDVNQIRHEAALVGPIFLEHAWELGPTSFDVACEKAGVIRAETRFVVSHPQMPLPAAVLRARAAAYGAELVWAPMEGAVPAPFAEPDDPEDPAALRPPYLADNARAAWRMVQWVAWRLGIAERLQNFRFDLGCVRLPGRMQVVRRHPLTVVDGCIHARSAAHAVTVAVRMRQSGRRIGLVLGIPADKDVAGVVQAFEGLADFVLLTRASNPHLHFDYRDVYRHGFAFPGGCLETSSVAEAVSEADGRLGPDDLLLLLGTQSFVGDVLRTFTVDTGSIWETVPKRGN
jgi:dihydrofolate synthase/folylpolyglutamate synthase